MTLSNEYEFKKGVDRYKGDLHSIKFSCHDLFWAMSFAQFTDSAGLMRLHITSAGAYIVRESR